MDQLSVVKVAKNSSEILDDATLTSWYGFDQNSFTDSGPNEILGMGDEIVFENEALLFNKTNSYFQASGFVLLGINNRSYSFSIWINPLETNDSTILHAYQNNPTNDIWCLTFLRLNSHGRIQAASRSSHGLITTTGPSIASHIWTHIVQTYSTNNGLRLYINGTLYNGSTPSDYRSSSTPLILRLGNAIDHGNETCLNTTTDAKQYVGSMDEFRVYSRELTSTDVQTLASR